MLLRGLRLYTRGVLQQLGASTRRGLSTSSSATGFAATTKKAGAGTFSAREREVLRVLRTVKHPDTGKDVVMDGMIAEVREKDGVVSVELHLDKHYRSLKASCVEALTRALTPPASPSDSAAAATEQRWLRSVRVNMSSVPSASELEYRATAMRKGNSAPMQTLPGAAGPRGLSRVKHVIAVSSGKGGVGKSTVAVNLAFALARLKVPETSSASGASTTTAAAGATDAPPMSTSDPSLTGQYRVGLFDADIYGPSLPVLVKLPSPSPLTFATHTHFRSSSSTNAGSHGDSSSSSSPGAPALLRERVVDGDSRIVAPMFEGVKLMSYGYVKPGQVRDTSNAAAGTGAGAAAAAPPVSASALMRGPMVSQLVNELITRTDWGELDFLVVDMPPGTGDIHLTLAQNVKIATAVVVTTPQQLSFVDVVKGIDLFAKTKVPVCAVVENMAYFLCGNCDTKHAIFGDIAPYRRRLREEWGVDQCFEMPLVPSIARHSDAGEPFVLDDAEDSMSAPAAGSDVRAKNVDVAKAQSRQVFASLAASVRDFVSGASTTGGKGKNGQPAYDQCEAVYDSAAGAVKVVTKDAQGREELVGSIPSRTLRLACRCAGCVDEFSGVSLIRPERIPQNVFPRTITPKGRYAVGIIWSDGHSSSIYPWDRLMGMVGK